MILHIKTTITQKSRETPKLMATINGWSNLTVLVDWKKMDSTNKSDGREKEKEKKKGW